MAAVDEIIAAQDEATPERLIPLLQDIQAAEGYVSRQAMAAVAEALGTTSSRVYGVATFYNQFRFKPVGKYHIMICRGTACHVKGSAAVLKMCEEVLGIKAGDTTRDGLFSIEVVACIGACGLAPVISVNGEFHAKVNADKLRKLVEDFKAAENSNGK